MIGKPIQMSDRLRELIEKARHHKMTPEEKFEQRVSFIYGQQDHDSPGKTKDEIRQMLIDMEGRPPAHPQADEATVERVAPVAWLYASDFGDKELLLDCNGEQARRLLELGWTEMPLYAAKPQPAPVDDRVLNTSPVAVSETTDQHTQADDLVERLDWAKLRDGDTVLATGESLTWLIQQLARWPTRVHPERTTNVSFLMGSAARTLDSQAATIKELKAEVERWKQSSEYHLKSAASYLRDGAALEARAAKAEDALRLCEDAWRDLKAAYGERSDSWTPGGINAMQQLNRLLPGALGEGKA